MDITSLKVQNLRTHKLKQFDITERVTVITGKNGSGKTTLLEALYLALRGTSFRGSDGDILSYDQPWWRTDIGTTNGLRTIKYDNSGESPQKTIVVDDRQFKRMPISKRVPVVLFEPDDLRLLHGSPARRRKFIDTLISQIDPNFSTILRKYERALKQRNALLKKDFVSQHDMFAWDMALAEYGAKIIAKRIAVIEKINQTLCETYRSIANTDDVISLHYSHTLIDNIQQKLVDGLHASFRRDQILGFTSTGPHRHDCNFIFNNQPAAKVASRGEVRSIILALKFIEVDITAEITGIAPIVLLDDVFAELDEDRQRRLAEKCRDNQMFITSTNAYTGIDTKCIIQLD